MPIPNEKEITLEEAMNIIRAYNSYIQTANDEDRYQSGWRPVCIDEFYDSEMQDDEDHRLVFEFTIQVVGKGPTREMAWADAVDAAQLEAMDVEDVSRIEVIDQDE